VRGIGRIQCPKGDLIVTAPIIFGHQHVIPIAIEFRIGEIYRF
jgi:hypothetical protein